MSSTAVLLVFTRVPSVSASSASSVKPAERSSVTQLSATRVKGQRSKIRLLRFIKVCFHGESKGVLRCHQCNHMSKVTTGREFRQYLN